MKYATCTVNWLITNIVQFPRTLWSPENSSSIVMLHCYTLLLHHKLIGPWLSCDGCHSFSRMWTKAAPSSPCASKVSTDIGGETVQWRKHLVVSFVAFSVTRDRSWAHGCPVQTADGHGVWECKIPGHASSAGLRQHGKTIRSLSVVSVQAVWFQHCKNIRQCQSLTRTLTRVTVDVDCITMHVPAVRRLAAREAACSLLWTCMQRTHARCANWDTRTQRQQRAVKFRQAAFRLLSIGMRYSKRVTHRRGRVSDTVWRRPAAVVGSTLTPNGFQCHH
jgi:hypothetical protein